MNANEIITRIKSNPYWVTLGATGTAVALYLAFRKVNKDQQDETFKIPGPTANFFFGNVLELSEDPLQKLEEYSSKHGKDGIFRYMYFGEPTIVVTDPSLVEYILSTKGDNFTKERDQFVADIVGNGLLVSQGHFWNRQRRIMMPAFSNMFIKDNFSSFVNVTNILLSIWDQKCTDGVLINLREDMTKITVDIIAVVAFGKSLNALENPKGKLPQAVTDILHETELRVFQLFPFWKLPFYPGTIRFERAKKILVDELYSLIKSRRSDELTNPTDLLGRLLLATDEETGEVLTDEQLLDEAMTILLAGHETTSNAMGFIFYSIATHPIVEDKLFNEIQRIVGDRIPQYEDLQQMKYLDLVIKETMRLYPPASQLADRRALEDDKIGPYKISKGSAVEIWPWLLHRDSKYWTQPLSFIPERFEYGEPKHRFSYLPFSLGKRSCIGNRVAEIEMKLITVMVLQRFKMTLVDSQHFKPTLNVTLRPDNLVVQLERRI